MPSQTLQIIVYYYELPSTRSKTRHTASRFITVNNDIIPIRSRPRRVLYTYEPLEDATCTHGYLLFSISKSSLGTIIILLR